MTATKAKPQARGSLGQMSGKDNASMQCRGYRSYTQKSIPGDEVPV